MYDVKCVYKYCDYIPECYPNECPMPMIQTSRQFLNGIREYYQTETRILCVWGRPSSSMRMQAAFIVHIQCPTRYRTRHFFNNSNTNEDIATKFEHEYVLIFHISYTVR